MDARPTILPKYPPIAWAAVPLLWPAAALLLGIWGARAAGYPTGLLPWAGTLLLWSVAVALTITGPRPFGRRRLPGQLLLLLTVLLTGFTYAGLRHAPNRADYFAHSVQEDDLLVATVASVRPTAKRLQLRLDVHGLLDTTAALRPTDGQTITYVLPDERGAGLIPGDRLLLAARVVPTDGPLNPGATDFRAYWAGQGIYHQAWLREPSAYRLLGKATGSNWRHWGDGARDAWLSKIRDHLDGDALAVAAALVLGKKDLLTSDVKSAYADTGAIHVLAVSGLHVGIVASLVLGVLAWFRPRALWGRALKATLVVVAIWAFAVVTGLSPSVQRAAVMFSILTVGSVLRRQAGLFNLLSLAAILMVVWQPRQLFQVGFQLSFLAVAGIGLFGRPITDLVRTAYRVVRKIWSALVVSTAAQLGTLPLTLHYFGRFPLYFLLSGTLVVLSAFAVLCLGILHGVVAGLFDDGVLASITGGLLRFVVELQNAFIHFFGRLPGGVLEINGVGPWLVVVLTGWLLLLAYWLYYRGSLVRTVLLAGALGLLTYAGYRHLVGGPPPRLVIYHLPRVSLLDLYGPERVHPVGTAEDPLVIERAAGGARQQWGGAVTERTSVYAVDTVVGPDLAVSYPLIGANDLRLLVLDGNREAALLDTLPAVDVVWIVNGYRPDRMPAIGSTDRCTVVVDGSSPRYRWSEWERTTAAAGLPLHLTGRDGAFVLPLR